MTRDRTTRRSFLKAGAGAVAATTAAPITLTYDASANSDAAVNVTIKRDNYGVPHVYARNADGMEPTFFGYGFAAAEDRLFQLEMYRRKYHGTTAEVLGAGPDDQWVAFDRASRTNRSGSDVPAQLDALDDRYTNVLEAFADGVNRYIEHVEDETTDRAYHKAFHEYGFRPEPWNREDVAGVYVATMAFFMGFQLETFAAFLRGQLGGMYDADKAASLFDDIVWGEDPGAPTTGEPASEGYQPPFTPPTLSDPTTETDGSTGQGRGGKSTSRRTSEGVPSGGTSAFRLPRSPGATHQSFVEHWHAQARGLDDLGLALKIGSNALAVHGDATESGDAILYGGPQMGFSSPSVMHEVGLHGPDFDVTGSTVAGFPFLMFGHNNHGAFTTTAGLDNLVQTFVETVREDPDGDGYQYEFRGDWYPVEETTESIAVKDGASREVTVRRTRHGVVVDWRPEQGEAVAMARSYEDRELSSWRGLFDPMFADDADSFVEACKPCDYSINWLWADESGDIAYAHQGRYPDWTQVEWDTRLPADGTRHELTDDDYLRLADEEVPFAVVSDPDAHGRPYLANWNNKPAPGWNNGDLSYAWGTDHRVQRIANLTEHRLAATGAVSYGFMKDVVHDIAFVDLRAIRYKGALLDALADADLTTVEAAARDALADWNNHKRGAGDDFMGELPPGFTVFDAFFPRLLEEAFEGTYGPVFEAGRGTFFDYRYGRPLLMRALHPDQAALEPAVDYFDGDPAGALTTAFRAAVSDLRAEFESDDVSAWTRSAAVDELDNMSLFGMPVGVADPGDMPLQNRGTENHFVRLGNDSPEPAEGNRPFVAENVLPPGNSGYVAPDGTKDEHYADQLAEFVAFRYKRLRFTDAEVNRDLESTHTVRPETGSGGSDAAEGRGE